jgi:cell division protein FtsB
MKQSKKSKFLRDPRRRRRRSARLFQVILLIFFVSIVATVVYVWERVQAVRQQVVISELRAQIQKLQTDNEYLRTELLRLSGTAHLESVARTLGFTYGSSEQIIRLPQ